MSRIFFFFIHTQSRVVVCKLAARVLFLTKKRLFSGAPAEIMSAPKTFKLRKLFLASRSKSQSQSQEKEDAEKWESLSSEYAEPSSPMSPSEKNKKKKKRFGSWRSKKKPSSDPFFNSSEQFDFPTSQE